ncbi:DUF6932 family protein [Cellulomonas palmilytica]|uniref:DUF6932 family protein n=1 Tax=Cellulomonas palmilytica TaxID=2608402 RepID=UPI001F46FB1A|nr:hypothetical protein [Cellulomonas palmilytica]UJP40818.1 hypothetical protein F1D97_04850 [Cellulomonas palmilytica]
MLGENGYLPVGRHVVTAEEFKQHFVDAFPESKTRARLHRRWERHLEALTSVIPVEAQWIDGSFVTGKVDPGDIDLVTFIDGPQYDALAPGLQSMVAALLAGKQTKAVWGMDSYPAFRYPQGHPAQPLADDGINEWHEFWQKQREQDGLVKGYLEVRL